MAKSTGINEYSWPYMKWKSKPHSCENDYHQEHKQHQLLARMWGKRTLMHCQPESNLVQPLWKKYGGSSQLYK
jgi:hypothetical protein